VSRATPHDPNRKHSTKDIEMTDILDPPAPGTETQRIVILPATRPALPGRVYRPTEALPARRFYLGRHRAGTVGKVIRWAVR
jgi:hypothetical protein